MDNIFANMAEGGMADIVPQCNRLGEVFVHTDLTCDCPGDLRYLKGVCQPCSDVLIHRSGEADLRLVHQSSEGLAIEDPVFVVLERASLILRMECRKLFFRLCELPFHALRVVPDGKGVEFCHRHHHPHFGSFPSLHHWRLSDRHSVRSEMAFSRSFFAITSAASSLILWKVGLIQEMSQAWKLVGVSVIILPLIESSKMNDLQIWNIFFQVLSK